VISVVIPCYNQARFLGEAIASVREQTVGNAEIIVVDDGSTDDTVAVARREGAQCVSQRNQGQGAARNEGLRHVTREFVVFLDSDDRLLPNAFETALRHLRRHPGRAFVTGRCVVFDDAGVYTDIRYAPLVERDHYLSLLESNFIWMPACAMFRTGIVREVGGFKTWVTGAEDYDLYLRIARRHPIVCHDEFVAAYRQHGSSTSRRAPLMLRSTVNVMRAQWNEVKGDASAEAAWRRGMRQWQYEYGEEIVSGVRRQLRTGQWRQALPAMGTLLRYYPGGAWRHMSRKLSRVFGGHKPEALDDPFAGRNKVSLREYLSAQRPAP
jgi:glycosyltransferase involved in cell wall biosynthesis